MGVLWRVDCGLEAGAVINDSGDWIAGAEDVNPDGSVHAANITENKMSRIQNMGFMAKVWRLDEQSVSL